MHPFPPVVRWAIFPALAVVAAVAGAKLGIHLTSSHHNLVWMAGGLAAGAAAAAMLTRRAWPCLLAAFPFGLLGAAAGVAVFETLVFRVPGNPWATLAWALRKGDALLLLGGSALSQVGLQRLGERRSWILTSLAGAGIAAAIFGVALLVVDGGPDATVGAVLALSTLAQVPAALAAKAVARRLRPPEAA